MKFLLELSSEEIPARMQAAAAEQLRSRLVDGLKAAGLSHGDVVADATPRRLWLVADDVAAASAASVEERKGPAASAPEAAIAGFLRGVGLTRDQLEERETPKGVVLFAQIASPGRDAAAILAELVPGIVRDFQWPKSMRWGQASVSTASPRWVRPLTGIVAMLDGDVVPCEVHGIVAGNVTRGHRIHAPEPVQIMSPDTYAAQLLAAKVVVSSAERRGFIVEKAAIAAAARGLSVVPDAGLVAENAGLTEWPVPMLGAFDPAFLAVPREVIQLTMRTNQKYFAVVDAAGALAPGFVCVANLEASDGGKAIVAGNERVLSARLSDAKFFWDQDVATVTAGGLEAFLPKLDDIVFFDKLGSLSQRVRRIEMLAVSLAPVVGADSHRTARAARLAKADLVTATVGEFPEAQGIIGHRLALHAREDDLVADAIRDHYKPLGPNDDTPSSPETVAVALAEKIDTLSVFFFFGQIPTGSRDPYALRRASLSVIRLLTENNIRLNLSSVFAVSIGAVLADVAQNQIMGRSQELSEFTERFKLHSVISPEKIQVDPKAFVADPAVQEAVLAAGAAVLGLILPFFADRLKVQQREAGVRHDLIDAVFALGGEDDLVRLLARVKALRAFVATEDGVNLLAGYKRAANILKIEAAKGGDVAPGLADVHPAEAALGSALDVALPAAAAAVTAEDFAGAMAALAGLRGPVDTFFADVMVNPPDPEIRARRLALLARFRDAVHEVADFSRIEG